jgi:hypothetical protein
MGSNPLEEFLAVQRATRIVRTRKNLLYTFGSTRLPYRFLAPSAVNEGDVVLRRGTVTVEPPKILAPRNPVEFEGFGIEDEEGAEGMVPVLLNRWVHFPPAKYQNSNASLEVVGGPLEAALERQVNELDRENDIRTGVVLGPEDRWGFSVIGYVGQMVARSAPSNIGEFFERFGFDGADGP